MDKTYANGDPRSRPHTPKPADASQAATAAAQLPASGPSAHDEKHRDPPREVDRTNSDALMDCYNG